MMDIIKKGVRFFAVVAIAGVLLLSCKKEEDLGRLYFPVQILPFESFGETKTVNFTYSDLVSVSISSTPKGWVAKVDMAKGVVTITAPEKTNTDHVESGTVIITGDPTQGSLVSYSLYVGIMSTVDLSDKWSNSYVVSQKNSYYNIDVTHKGESTDKIAPTSASLIWQTAGSPLKYVSYKDGKVSFYVHANDTDKTKLQEGNALIGAYDAAGSLLWSWHVWVANYDPDKEPVRYTNGYTVMSRNLGALDNACSTTAEILASYGMYYQWGRKEPFVGPSTYNASQGTFAPVYNGSGTRIYFAPVASGAETGTSAYALANPLSFITGNKASGYDWLYASHDTSRWSENVKSVNDPCPKGWCVPSPAVFQGLTVGKLGPASEYEDKYGWKLTDGSVESLYMGLGRRVYTDGKLQNVYNPLPVRNTALEAQPWEGLYWTTSTGTENRSSAFYFYFNKRDVQDSRVKGETPHYRANGMQIRCVKVK